MKARMHPHWLSVSILLLAIASTAAGEIIFFDDFVGDNTKGRFVMEAENYSGRLAGANANWWEVDGNDNTFIEGPSAGEIAPTARSGARGNYMEALGRQIGTVAPIDDLYDGPVLDYTISVESPGTYRLYVRGTARDMNSDSLYAFILNPDGTVLTGAGPDYFMYHQYRNDWIWGNIGFQNTTKCGFADSPVAGVWKISQPGEYTIRIALRENATALDALVFQTANLSAPKGSGSLQSLFFPTTIKLDARQIIVINGIRLARAGKIEVLDRIDAALEKDIAAHKMLEEMLGDGEYGSLSYSSIVAAKEEIHSAIQHEMQSKEALEKSIGKLEEGLRALGFELDPGVIW